MSAFGRGPRGYGYGVNISDEALRTLGAQLGRREQSDKGLGLALSIGEGHDFRQDDAARIHREVEQQAEQRRRVLEHLVQQQRDAEARNFQAGQHAFTLEGETERARLGREQALTLHGAGEKAQDERARLQREQQAQFHKDTMNKPPAPLSPEQQAAARQLELEKGEARFAWLKAARVKGPAGQEEYDLGQTITTEPSHFRSGVLNKEGNAERADVRITNLEEDRALRAAERADDDRRRAADRAADIAQKATDRAENQALTRENTAWKRYHDLANDYTDPNLDPDVEQRWAKAYPGKLYPPTGKLPQPPKPPPKSWWDRHFGSGGSGGPGMPGAQGGAGSFGARTLKPPYGEGNQEAEAAMARSAQTGPGPTASPFERAADAATARSEAPARFAQVRTFPPNPAGQADQERLAALRVRARPAGASLFGRQAAYTGIPSAYDTAPNGPISIGMPRREAVAYAQAEGGQKRDMTDVTIGVLLRLTPKDRFDKIMELRKTPEEALRRGINVEEVLAAMAGSAA